MTTLGTDIGSLEPGGGTAIYDCLGRAATVLSADNAGRKRLIVLMTDGMNNRGDTTGLDQVSALGVPVVAIGFGSDADTAALSSIAEVTHGAYIPSDNLVSALRQATSYR